VEALLSLLRSLACESVCGSRDFAFVGALEISILRLGHDWLKLKTLLFATVHVAYSYLDSFSPPNLPRRFKSIETRARARAPTPLTA